MSLVAVASLVLATALASVLGGLFVVRASWPERALDRLMALGAGFLLALALLDLIPESLEGGEPAALAMLLGFLVVFAFERIVSTHFHFGEETHAEKVAHRTASLGALIGMLIHSLFDGFSIVAGFEADARLGFLVFLAVLLHKVPDGLTISSLMLAAFGSRRRALLASLSFAAATIAGALMAWILSAWRDGAWAGEVPFTHLGLAFSAGVFLYVAGTDLLPAVNASEDRRSSLFVPLGAVLFYVTALLLHGFGLE